MTVRLALLLGLAMITPMLASGPLRAQDARENGGARGDRNRDVPVFRAGVSAVVVDTLVLDDDGQPVSGLTREDFEVLEDGVPQAISSFDVTDWTSYVAEQTGEGAGTDTGGERVNTQPRRFVLIMNRQGAKFTYLARAKRALSSFVVESLAEGDEAMVIDIGYATKIIQEFQPEKETTLEAIRTLSQMQMDYPLDPYRASQQIYEDLESISESLARLPGRKIVILLSPELATVAPTGSRYSDQGFAMKRAIDALNQANISVYSIDLYGVDGGPRSVYGGLSPLASETGGRYFKNVVSFEPALRRIGRENQRYYLLGYAPAEPPDGTYRKIEVRVSRPDVEVIARRGYYARRDASTEAETTDADEVASNEGPATETDRTGDRPDFPLAVELTTYLLPFEPGRVRVATSVAFPEELLVGEHPASVMELTVTDARGEVEEVIEASISLERYYVLRSLDLPPGPHLLSLVLRSEGDEVYRSSTGIDIPRDFGERFGLSSIIPVVSPDAVARVEASELPIRPTPTTPHGENTFVLFQVFPGSEAPAARARVSYRVLDERGAVVSTGVLERSIELERPDGAASPPIILSVPTRGLDHGTYRVEIRVQDETRGRSATGEIEIRLR